MLLFESEWPGFKNLQNARWKLNLNRAWGWCNLLFFMWLLFWVMPDCARRMGGLSEL